MLKLIAYIIGIAVLIAAVVYAAVMVIKKFKSNKITRTVSTPTGE